MLQSRGPHARRQAGPGSLDEADGLRLLREVPGAPPVPDVVIAEDDLLVTAAVEETARTSGHDESLGRALAALHASPLPPLGRGLVVDRSLPRRPLSLVGWQPASTAPGSASCPPAAGWRTQWPLSSPASQNSSRRMARRSCTVTSGGAMCSSASTAGRGSSIHRCTAATPRRISPCSPCSARCRIACCRAYTEVRPLSPGWEERVALFQLYPLLVHTVLFGGGYRAQAETVARRFG